MKESLNLAVKLFLITALSALLLAVSNAYTAPVISARMQMEYKNALKGVLPEADKFNKLDKSKFSKIKEISSNIEDVAIGEKNGENIGYAIKVVGKNAYKGEIIFLVGISKKDKKILGYEVLNSKETAGLGSRIGEEPFIKSVLGKSVKKHFEYKNNPTGENEVLALSGSTVSVKAIINGLNGVVDIIDSIE